jgi:hypothetical protein
MDAKVAETDLELEEAIRIVLSGKKDSEDLKRLRAQADQICREMGAKYGHRKIAVDLIRAARDEE